MTILQYFNENAPYIAIILLVLGLLCFALWLSSYHKLNKTKQQNNELVQKMGDSEMQYKLLQQRFADTTQTFEKIESEKNNWQLAATSLEKDFSAYKAASAAREEGLIEKITYLEKIKDDLSLKFKDISSEIIKAQHETFSNEQKNTLSNVLNPFKEQLQAFKEEVVATRAESIKNKSSLDTQLANLANMNLTLSKDAQNLAEALKGGKKMQGNWGECQLGRILEISGLRKGQDYDTQESFVNEDKKLYRPDVIIHLPGKRDIVIDSKVSLTDYLDAVNTEDEEKREKALQKNVAAIKAHIDELSGKEYQKLIKENSLNYVIMFIPVESAYIAALDYDRCIYDYAYKKNIILATPLSLLPTLRTVENLWRIDSQNQNVEKIAELGGKIYDKLATFVNDMKKLERGINQANNAYKDAMTKLTGNGGAVSQAEKLKELGAKTGKTINLTLNETPLLSAEEEENLLTAGE